MPQLLHPPKFNIDTQNSHFWKPKIAICERRYIFQTIIFGIYVKFPGCTTIESWGRSFVHLNTYRSRKNPAKNHQAVICMWKMSPILYKDFLLHPGSLTASLPLKNGGVGRRLILFQKEKNSGVNSLLNFGRVHLRWFFGIAKLPSSWISSSKVSSLIFPSGSSS